MAQSFEHIRALFVRNGSSDRNIADAETVWNQFTTDEQRLIYSRINYKLKHHLFVHYIPSRAIMDNAYGLHKQEGPIFLHGRALFDAMNQGLHLVQVDIPDRPEGRYPICTREDAERFHLKIIRDSWESVSEPTED